MRLLGQQLLCCAFMGLCAPGSSATEVTWRTVFEDQFDRETLGDQYEVIAGTATLDAGALKIKPASGTVQLAPMVSRDLRAELDLALDGPDARFGIQFASTGGGKETAWLTAAGCSIVGAGLCLAESNAALRLESTRPYRVVFQREGLRYTLHVQHALVLDGTVEQVIGATGIQHVLLLAEQGATIDNLRLSSRVPAHPDCCPPTLPWLPLVRQGSQVVARPGVTAPGLDEALTALNAKMFAEARARFEAMEDPTLKLVGLAHILGDLDYQERPAYGDRGPTTPADYGEFGEFAERWRQQAELSPDGSLLRQYLTLIEHAGRIAMQRWDTADAQAVADFDERTNPFAYKAGLYVARAEYWNAMEHADESGKRRALGRMRRLTQYWPENIILRQYLGPPVPWGEALNAATDEHPVWASYLREAYTRELTILERFIDIRQSSDGQFGGGWGDDVEMMRKWVPIAAISTCAKKVRGGIERLTEGIWSHRCLDGYDRQVDDVEHSSEPTADTFPTMLLLRYGDPRYVAFNLRAAKTIKERFMAIDQRGYPRFLSAAFGGEGVAIHDRSGFDTHYHARAMKHFAWLAWYGNQEARDWYLRWLDGWREIAMLDAPDKPSGIIPGTLFFPSGSYHPPDGSPWYAEGYHHMYGPWCVPSLMFMSFFQAYALSGDPKWLAPFQTLMIDATSGPLPRGELEPGSRESFRGSAIHTAGTSLSALYREYTGERVYDEYTMRSFGTAPQQYQIDHDLARYVRRFEAAAQSLRTNLDYWTTEVLATDRLHLPAVEDVWGAYTGAITTTGDAEPQTFAVTYDTPSPDFAALVVDRTPRRLRVWLYGFWEQPTEIGLYPWRLEPGEYVLTHGRQLPGEAPGQFRYAWQPPQQVHLLHRADPVRLTLPPRQVYVVDLRLARAAEVPNIAPDLALAPRDLILKDRTQEIAVHNIGNASATNVPVVLQRWEENRWNILSARSVDLLPAPTNLEPMSMWVVFDMRREWLTGPCRIVVDPDDTLFELCEANNIVTLPDADRPAR